MNRFAAIAVAIAVLAVLGLAIVSTWTIDRINTVEVQNEAAQKLSLAQQIAEACAAGELHGAICGEAVEAVQNPAPEAPRVIYVQGRPGPAGTAGKDGNNGRDGSNGQDGSSGRDGVDGKNGVDGAPGERGPEGPQGPSGQPGPSGPPGPPGADAQPPPTTPAPPVDEPPADPPTPPQEPAQGLVPGLLGVVGGIAPRLRATT